MNTIEFSHVWKKFKKGEKATTLRDFIPYFFGKMLNNKNHLNKKEEFWALRDVSFEVKRGETLGIIGPNGAGKSTILKILSGIMRPNKGDVKIKGRLSAIIEITAGFHSDLTGRENIYLNGSIMGMTKKEINKKFDSIVEFSGISEFIDTPVKRYSSGMYVRLGFAVAAHIDPDILLIDEVLAVGDIAFQAKCAQKMRELKSSGTTMVFVSHNLSAVQSICSRVILLNEGQIKQVGRPEEVISAYQDSVYEQSEKELAKKIASGSEKIERKDSHLIEITDVCLSNGSRERKKTLSYGEPISVKINYLARKPISDPVFSIGIIRSDGVNCCTADTKTDKVNIEEINGEGEFELTLNEANLTPGIYILNISVFDKDMIAPYIIRKKDIFRIEPSMNLPYRYGIFVPKLNWKINGKNI